MIIIVIFISIIAILIMLTYPGYYRAMQTARGRLLSNSEILETTQGLIEYSVKGQGIPVLLLHGAGGGYDQGLLIGEKSFGHGYQFISVSRFGYLRSPIPADASIKHQVLLYRAVLDHLNIKQVIVLAVSAGGPSAMQFANDYPDRTTALILMSAVSMPETAGDKPARFIKLIHIIQQSDYVYWLFSKFMQSIILNLLGVPAEVYNDLTPQQKKRAQEILNAMHPMSQRYSGTIQDELMNQLSNVSTARIAAPALILHAKDDSLVNYAHAINAHKKIVQSKLILFDTGGHIMLSNMAKVTDYTTEFLKNISD